MRRSGVQVLYPAPVPLGLPGFSTSAMKISSKPLHPLSHRLAGRFLLLFGILLGGAAVDESVTYAAGPDSLSASQTRLRSARDELDSAQSEVKRQERRLKDAEDSLARQQKRVEEEKTKVEQAKSALDDSKARAEQAKEAHDKAYAEIQRLYRERQQAPTPSTGPEAPKPQSN
jgi:septal ring factor EnvC (AmiA/AmiB activator)